MPRIISLVAGSPAMHFKKSKITGKHWLLLYVSIGRRPSGRWFTVLMRKS